ncbi:hypothetical protein [Streptomyces xanthophaeus]|uniref:hypothetical protein n=1 Tax=Streptomyces xanthophaeus TaxID=67385 RepID=UPI003712D0CB
MTGYEIVREQFAVAAGGGTQAFAADCPAGKRVISGGYYLFNNTGLNVIRDAPDELNGTAWTLALINTSGQADFVNVYAVCGNVTT